MSGWGSQGWGWKECLFSPEHKHSPWVALGAISVW